MFMYQLNKIRAQTVIYVQKIIIFAFFLAYGVFFVSCEANTNTDVLEKQDLFRLQYGSFENEIQLFNIHNSGDINTSLIMRDGFFYIANGEAGKIMQLTSYGDLIGLIYNNEKNPIPSFIDLSNDIEASALENQTETSTQIAVVYPFNNLSAIAVDSNKNLYAADFLPSDRFELDADSDTMLRQVILHFASDGTFIDYLGQEGPGGVPFPYIKALHTTSNNELVVMCLDEKGYIVYWFSQDGFLLHRIPIGQSALPPHPTDETGNSHMTLEQIVPDYEKRRLYLKIDYYQTKTDKSTMVQSEIVFDQTLVYPLDITTLEYGEPIFIPAYEKAITNSYINEVYLQPYNFLGVTESGCLFFIVTDESGFSMLIIQEDGQKIVRRHIDFPFEEIVFHDFSLSNTGILSAFMAEEDAVSVAWWRADIIIDAIMQ